MKWDLHIHTIYSAVPGFPFLRDSFNRFEDIVRVAQKKGIDGVGITDHNTIRGAVGFKEYVKRRNINLQVVIGEEVRTLSGDVIALDIDQEIPPKRTVQETVEIIKECNGLSVAAHPYAYNGIGEILVRSNRFDLIETINACCPESVNILAQRLASQLSLSGIGGSDAHRPEVIGNGYTQVSDNKHIRESLENGRTQVHGYVTSRLTPLQKILLRLKNPLYIFCNPWAIK
ncbi:PHP domain-containing protein [[Eubacterium] cellulosolvens]